MKAKRKTPPNYNDAVEFALTAADQPREFYGERLHLYVQPATANRPDLTGKVYLEVYEKVPGGIIFLNWWAPVTRGGIQEFFKGLAELPRTRVSRRPYRLSQACDGTIGPSVLHAYKVACDALGLDADALYLKAYGDRREIPPDWKECRRHAEWQGGVEWPATWDARAVAGLAESLTEINFHSLRGAFTAAAADALSEKKPREER